MNIYLAGTTLLSKDAILKFAHKEYKNALIQSFYFKVSFFVMCLSEKNSTIFYWKIIV